MLYFIIGVTLLVAATALFILLQKKNTAERNRDTLLADLENVKNRNRLLEQLVEDARAEQDNLKNELEAKNKKLAAKALYQSGKNERILKITTLILNHPELSKDKDLPNLIKPLESQLKEDGEWNDFIAHFEEVNNSLLNRVKKLHPSLTSSDIRFIAYIYMNLSTKEIASMLNITFEACRKRKERIAAKMDMPRDMKLFDYISNL